MNCDRLARWYRWLEYAGFGRALERRRETFLPKLPDARRVLMLGEGDGRFLAKFLECNPLAEVNYVDSSGRMLALARRRAAQSSGSIKNEPGRICFHQSEALAWLRGQPSAGYDTICTHFFLDCFTNQELAILVPEIARLAAGHSRWIVSEFRYLPKGLGRLLSRDYVACLYQFFRLTTGLGVRRLPDYAAALSGAGFRLREHEFGFGGLLVSEFWERI